MELRSSSRTATPTSGPGRGPLSDSRSRHRRHDRRTRTRRHEASAAALRLRADALFTEHAQGRRESGNGPPEPDRDDGDAGRLPASWSPPAELIVGEPAGSEPTVDEPVSFGADGEAGAWRDRAGLAVRERLPLWLQSRCGLERRSVAALTVLLAVAAVFAVQHFWTGRTRPVRAPEVMSAAAPYAGKHAPGDRQGGESAVPAGAPSGPGAGGGVVVVDVGGKVRSPGLQRLPAGSRVEDALRAAGGLRPGTDSDGLNRARFLVDGEQIMVGVTAPPTGAGSGGAGGGPFGAGGSAAGGVPSAPIPLNTATVDQFDSLPGVGPVLARHIVDYRAAHGGFRSVDELREVNGIGDRRFADLRDLVRP
ncbi:ComEA family DNA-binding protein [Streptomyces sp. NPDC059445]|uniref:ComEA family DNA-binding protein n=1 Tax=Streptomyces sp. NPDC059445 TaxID=3346832 RepID=UPI00368E5825